jgi:hypothetical protein
MNDNQDLDAVRALRAGVVEPDDLAVARTRARIGRSLDGEPVHSRRRAPGWLAVAASAVTATAVIVGIGMAVTGNRGGGGTTAVGAASPTSATPVPSAGPSASASPQAPSVDMTRTPVRVGPGQLLYVHGSAPGYSHEMWLDVNGAIALAIGRADDGEQPWLMMPEDMADETARLRKELAKDGPSLNRPTPAYLATLPTDPTKLAALLERQLNSDPRDAKHAPGYLAFKGTSGLLYTVEPLLTPAVRAALIKALQELPGTRVDRTPRRLGDHRIYLVEQVTSTSVIGLCVDAQTGRIVGDFAGARSGDPRSHPTLWEFGVATEAGVAP